MKTAEICCSKTCVNFGRCYGNQAWAETVENQMHFLKICSFEKSESFNSVAPSDSPPDPLPLHILHVRCGYRGNCAFGCNRDVFQIEVGELFRKRAGSGLEPRYENRRPRSEHSH